MGDNSFPSLLSIEKIQEEGLEFNHDNNHPIDYFLCLEYFRGYDMNVAKNMSVGDSHD